MAQQQFNPTPDVTTHSDARTIFNANFQDAEDRLAAIESTNISLQFSQQTITSSAGSLVLDVSSGYNAKTTLTEDASLTITGASAGDSGLIIFRQDATGSWNVTSSSPVLSGILSNISIVTPNEVGVCSVSWYYDGTDYLLYVSDVT
jgi:hypothetical protein